MEQLIKEIIILEAMKSRIITLLFILGTLTTVYGQQIELEKASPFTAVKWEKEQPIVKFNGEWYQFEKLDRFSKKQLLEYCMQRFGDKWQKRFSEDLIEVLKEMNYKPNKKVQLVLSKNGKSQTITSTLTTENRFNVLIYNKKNSSKSKLGQKRKTHISKVEAIEDINEFEYLLGNYSSYVWISNFNYKKAIDELREKVKKKFDLKVSVDDLSNDMAKIMAQVGDRHSSVRNLNSDKKRNASYNVRLPFGLSVLRDSIVALKQDKTTKTYHFLHDDYPYVKSINGIDINTFITKYAYHGDKAPKEARLSNGANIVQKFGLTLYYNNLEPKDVVEIIFTNGEKDKAEGYKLTAENKGYVSELELLNDTNIAAMQKNEYDGLSKILRGNIGYINIPMMMHYEEKSGLEAFINSSLQEFTNTKSLIIDIRNNPGGGREILSTFSEYLVQPEQSPWVANVAYLRTDKRINIDVESMSGRYLYIYKSETFDTADRAAIDAFNIKFKTIKNFEKSKFSIPFYMVLRSGKRRYTKPVYIFVNEHCFSAATVFTTAFKGLPNVKIVGVTTDGSSGNSRKKYLKNSGIRVKVSTTLSFQRNGKTLDGNGTNPDIYIPVDTTQLLTGKDTQLDRLVKMIIAKD